jgi:type 1 glutamine amidotransferase
VKARSGAALAFCVLLAAACSSEKPTLAPEPADTTIVETPKIRVLMLTATTGFRHDSIETARPVMTNLAASSGAFTVTSTEDVASITAATLSAYDVLFFALTTGELPLTPDQKAAIVDFVTGGKGLLGVHSATDTLYEWPDYGRLIGAYFKEHTWTQPATVVVEDPSHPAASGLGQSFSIMEEFYTFRENPRPNVQVLLRLDAASVGATGDFPLAWSQAFGGGRTYYNALGHFSSTWNDVRFQQQLVGAIRWLARRT